MIKLPDELIAETFLAQLSPAAILRTNLDFGDGHSKIKRLVVLGLAEELAYAVKTTSTNLERYHENNPYVRGHYVSLAPAEVTCLEKATIIDFRKVYPLSVAQLCARHKAGTLDFLGILPKALLDHLCQGILESKRIERGLKTIIREFLNP